MDNLCNIHGVKMALEDRGGRLGYITGLFIQVARDMFATRPDLLEEKLYECEVNKKWPDCYGTGEPPETALSRKNLSVMYDFRSRNYRLLKREPKIERIDFISATTAMMYKILDQFILDGAFALNRELLVTAGIISSTENIPDLLKKSLDPIDLTAAFQRYRRHARPYYNSIYMNIADTITTMRDVTSWVTAVSRNSDEARLQLEALFIPTIHDPRTPNIALKTPLEFLAYAENGAIGELIRDKPMFACTRENETAGPFERTLRQASINDKTILTDDFIQYWVDKYPRQMGCPSLYQGHKKLIFDFARLYVDIVLSAITIEEQKPACTLAHHFE